MNPTNSLAFSKMASTVQAIQDLHQQSVLQQAEEQLRVLRDQAQQIDQELLEREADLAWLEQRKTLLQSHQDEIAAELSKHQLQITRLQARQKLSDQHQLMIQDLSDFARGLRFQSSADGARFFTQSAADFSRQLNLGDLELQKILNSSADGLSIIHQQKCYRFLSNREGQSFFHPEPVDFAPLST